MLAILQLIANFPPLKEKRLKGFFKAVETSQPHWDPPLNTGQKLFCFPVKFFARTWCTTDEDGSSHACLKFDCCVSRAFVTDFLYIDSQFEESEIAWIQSLVIERLYISRM